MSGPTLAVPQSEGRAALLVAEREINAQVRSRSFVISTAILLLVVLAGIVVPSLLSRDGGPLSDATGGAGGGEAPAGVRVAVVPELAPRLTGLAGIAAVPAADEAGARAQVERGDVEAAVVLDAGPAGVRVVALDEAPEQVVGALTVAPAVEVLNPATANENVRMVITLGFGVVFMLAAMGFGSTIAQNTVVEKQTRVVEILLSAVPPRALLGGKIIGNSVLALGQIAAMAAVAVLGLVLTGQDEVLSLVGAPMAWFVVFFAVGFVLLAAMFAAAASLVSRIEDTGPVLQPVMWLVILPYFLVVFGASNDAVLRVASWVPFSAPVAMPVRLYLGDAAWWEPLGALLLLAAAAALVIALAAKVYERSVLRMGARVHLKEVLGHRAATS